MQSSGSEKTGSVLAPAKVNLYLRVLRRRPDGYHDIESLVLPISLRDRIRIRCGPGRGIAISCSDPSIPTGRGSLVWRAAALALRCARKDFVRVEIALRKEIPVAAGLGGGSSDAAAVLRGVASLLGAEVPVARLARAARAIGADVPFFVYSQPARIRGIGDRVEVIAGLPRLWMVVLWPRVPISARWAYTGWDRIRQRGRSGSLTKKAAISMIRSLGEGRELPADALGNDLEPVVLAAHPELSLYREALLEKGAKAALMSGSGSAFFGLYAARAEAERAARSLRARGYWARAVHTIG